MYCSKVEYEFEEYKLGMEKKLTRILFENEELTNKVTCNSKSAYV